MVLASRAKQARGGTETGLAMMAHDGGDELVASRGEDRVF